MAKKGAIMGTVLIVAGLALVGVSTWSRAEGSEYDGQGRVHPAIASDRSRATNTEPPLLGRYFVADEDRYGNKHPTKRW
jgi:hypothetical protein